MDIILAILNITLSRALVYKHRFSTSLGLINIPTLYASYYGKVCVIYFQGSSRLKYKL